MLADHTLVVRAPLDDAYALKGAVYDRLCAAGVALIPRAFIFGRCPIDGGVIVRCTDTRLADISTDVTPVPQPLVGTVYDFCLRATPMRQDGSSHKKLWTDPQNWFEHQAAAIGVDLIAYRHRTTQLWCSKPTGTRDGFFMQDVVYVGRLRVIDAVKLSVALEHGIGRHRAFGFGLMQLFAAAEERG